MGPLKHGHYRQVVIIQKHWKLQPLNKVVIMYRFSKKVSLSNLTWKLSWAKPTFYKVHRSCKQLNEVSRSGKVLHKVTKICNQLCKFHRICQKLYKLHRICQQLYKVCGTHKHLLWSLQKLQTTLQRSWDSPITFGKSIRPKKTLWSLYICRSDLSAWKFFFT